jgi:hypothetical protein
VVVEPAAPPPQPAFAPAVASGAWPAEEFFFGTAAADGTVEPEPPATTPRRQRRPRA